MRIHSVLRAAGRTEEASAFLTQWIEKYPKDTRFMSMQADLALRRGEWSAAEKLYLLVLGLEPESADAMNNLAWAMIEQNKAAATDLARRAVRMRPDRADFMDTLSMALAKDKKLTEAIANQKKAVALAPDEPMLQLNLARLALEVSDHSLAREQLDKLSALGNKFPAQSEVYKLRRRLPG
jgi:predicted Zn-dependent protease